MKSNTRKKKNTSDSPECRAKRIFIFTIILSILLIALIFRIGWLQFIKGSTLKEAATRQQTTSRIISPNRGSIYDSSGVPIAISATVDTVTINPQKFIVEDSEDETKKLQEKVSKAFSEIFELDYNEVYEKVTSTKNVQTIVKKVEEDKIIKLKDWMKQNEIYSIMLLC